jgi:hypothetical protein
MASRRNNQGAGILIAIGLIVAAVAFLGPFAIALWVLIKEAKAFRYGGARKAADIISADERDALGRAEAEIAALRTDAAEIQYRGDQLGLQRRLEGSRFDARNRQSRDLNAQLDHIEGEIAALSLRLGDYQAQLSSRLEAWLRAITGRAAARVALLAFMTAFAVVMLGQIETLGGSASLSRLLVGAPGDGSARAAASLLATLIALVAGWIAGAVRRASLAA